MSLSKRLADPPRPQHGYPCSVGALLAQLKGTELDALRTMLGTPQQRGWPASEIYTALTEEGYTVGLQTINRHRGGKCRCER